MEASLSTHESEFAEVRTQSRQHVGNPGFQDFDEFLLGSSDLEAMPFEFGCDFATAFEDKHLDGDAKATAAGSKCISSTVKPVAFKETPVKAPSRGQKRKNDQSSSSSSASADDDVGGASTHVGRWTKKEHELFLEGLKLYGKSWKKISSLVVTRTLVQIRTHAQKYLQKQNKSAMKAAQAATTSSSASSRSSRITVTAKKQLDDAVLTTAWKPSNPFHAIAFPESSSSVSLPTVSATTMSSLPSSFPLHHFKKESTTMSKLDQLLHETGPDELYTSPAGTDEDLTQWLHHRHLPLNSPAICKRRRFDTSSSNSAWAIVNPMEAVSQLPPQQQCFSGPLSSTSSHSQAHNLQLVDFLPPLSAFTAHSSDNDFSFGHSWL